MLESVFDDTLLSSINLLNNAGLYELRIRASKPCIVNYFNKYYFLGKNGLESEKEKAFYFSNSDISNIIARASNFSLYAINEQLKKGFISCENGIRIGVCGEEVCEDEQVITLKNISSLVFRFPHEIKGVSEKVIDYLFSNNEFCNTIILSSPGNGKTTLLRDLIRMLASKEYAKNVLVIDERNELSASCDGNSSFDLGLFSDIYLNENKQRAILNGVRSLAPDIIATDEIGTKQDIESLLYLSTCGVRILATLHAESIEDLLNKADFDSIISQKVFKRYIVLSNKNGKGTVENIFDENFNSTFKEKAV